MITFKYIEYTKIIKDLSNKDNIGENNQIFKYYLWYSINFYKLYIYKFFNIFLILK